MNSRWWIEGCTLQKQYKKRKYYIHWTPIDIQRYCSDVTVPHLHVGRLSLHDNTPWYFGVKPIYKREFNCKDIPEALSLFESFFDRKVLQAWLEETLMETIL